jgi:tetratricopeptide (TPR) repeat protein
LTNRAQAWQWLTTERDTLLEAVRLAAEHHMPTATIALAAAARFLAMQPRAVWKSRLAAESHGLLAARLSANRVAEAALRASRADTYQMIGQWTESDTDLQRLLELAHQLNDSALRGEALCGLGRNHKLQHHYIEAIRHYQKALPLVRGTSSAYVEAVAECNLSQIYARLGQHQKALRHARRELVLRQACGESVGEAYALHNLAVAQQGLGNHQAAIQLGERARALYEVSEATQQYLAGVLDTVAISLNHTGDHLRARHYHREAAIIRAECGASRST